MPMSSIVSGCNLLPFCAEVFVSAAVSNCRLLHIVSFNYSSTFNYLYLFVALSMVTVVMVTAVTVAAGENVHSYEQDAAGSAV